MSKGEVAIGYDRGAYPGFAQHVAAAQNSGLPGRSKPLTKLTSGQVADKNRAKACPTRLKRPTGYSCDEYPFASTQQGAYYGGGSGRSFNNCNISDKSYPIGVTGAKGFSAWMIPATENSTAGSDLSKFYREARILSGDSFYVQVL